MTLWLVRAGKHGEREALALDKGVAVIGWEDMPDLAGVKQRQELEALLASCYPDEKPKTLSNWESQLWRRRTGSAARRRRPRHRPAGVDGATWARRARSRPSSRTRRRP